MLPLSRYFKKTPTGVRFPLLNHVSRRQSTASDNNDERRRRAVRRPNASNNSPSLFSQVDEILRNSKSQQGELGTKTRKMRPQKQSLVPATIHPPGIETGSDSSGVPVSLFDIFKISEPSFTPTNPHMYEMEAYERYIELLEPIIQGESMSTRLKMLAASKGKVFIEPIMVWLKAREPTLTTNLPSFASVLESVGSSTSGAPCKAPSMITRDIPEQRLRFQEHHRFTQKQYALAVSLLANVTSHCARQANSEPVVVIWQKVKEAGMIDQKLLHTLLYLAASACTRQRHRHQREGASILDVLDTQDRHARDLRGSSSADGRDAELVDEIAAYHDLLYEPTEQTTNINVRLLVAQGRPQEAEELLSRYRDKMDLRLRSFTPIFNRYLEQKDLASALRLYYRMLSIPPVHLDCDTYISLLVGLAEQGCFAHGAEPVMGAKADGVHLSHGLDLLNDIATQMAVDVTEIPIGSAKRLYNAFVAGSPADSLRVITSFAPLPLVEDRASNGELVLDRVRIDPTTGVCPRTGVKLRLIRLEEDESVTLKESIYKLARTMQVKFHENHKSPEAKKIPKARADENLQDFFRWLDERVGEPFTAVIDAANIGYFMQNFESGRFNYHQIKFVVDCLEAMGENPLVVLPFKYSRPYFYVTIGAGGSFGSRKQTLTKDEMAVRDDLINAGKVFIVPRGFLDDFYWILASLSKQTNSRKGRDLFVEPGNTDDRWPGGRPVLISNDQMRDHKVAMLEPRLFRRWYSNFIVNYRFEGFVGGGAVSHDIDFAPADFFSREIQGNITSDRSIAWHFPIEETEDEWFCIRIPRVDGRANEYL